MSSNLGNSVPMDSLLSPSPLNLLISLLQQQLESGLFNIIHKLFCIYFINFDGISIVDPIGVNGILKWFTPVKWLSLMREIPSMKLLLQAKELAFFLFFSFSFLQKPEVCSHKVKLCLRQKHSHYYHLC